MGEPASSLGGAQTDQREDRNQTQRCAPCMFGKINQDRNMACTALRCAIHSSKNEPDHEHGDTIARGSRAGSTKTDAVRHELRATQDIEPRLSADIPHRQQHNILDVHPGRKTKGETSSTHRVRVCSDAPLFA